MPSIGLQLVECTGLCILANFAIGNTCTLRNGRPPCRGQLHEATKNFLNTNMIVLVNDMIFFQ